MLILASITLGVVLRTHYRSPASPDPWHTVTKIRNTSKSAHFALPMIPPIYRYRSVDSLADTPLAPQRPRRQPPRCIRPHRGSDRARAAARGPVRPPPAERRPARPGTPGTAGQASRGARRAIFAAQGSRPRLISGSMVICLAVLRHLRDVRARRARSPAAPDGIQQAYGQSMKFGTFQARIGVTEGRRRGAEICWARIMHRVNARATSQLAARPPAQRWTVV